MNQPKSLTTCRDLGWFYIVFVVGSTWYVCFYVLPEKSVCCRRCLTRSGKEVLHRNLSKVVNDHVAERGEGLSLVGCGQAYDLGARCAACCDAVEGVFEDDGFLWTGAEHFHAFEETFRIRLGFGEMFACEHCVHKVMQLRMCGIGVGHLDVVRAGHDGRAYVFFLKLLHEFQSARDVVL